MFSCVFSERAVDAGGFTVVIVHVAPDGTSVDGVTRGRGAAGPLHVLSVRLSARYGCRWYGRLPWPGPPPGPHLGCVALGRRHQPPTTHLYAVLGIVLVLGRRLPPSPLRRRTTVPPIPTASQLGGRYQTSAHRLSTGPDVRHTIVYNLN